MPLTETEQQEFNMHFLLLDTDSDGFLSTNDVGRLLRSVGLYPTNAEVQATITLVDPDGTGKVSRDHLLATVESLKSESTIDEALREAFKVLNEDGSGYLTTAQLRHILLNLGVKLTHEEADEVITDAEKDSEGQIAIDDLITMLLTRSAFGEK